MTAPSVFISYSHKDEEWKDRLVSQLKVLQMQDMLNVWDDRRIEAGEVWNEEIDAALNTASAAVFIVTDNFLTSSFILNEEVPRLLERHNKEGVKIFPLIAEPCRWQEVPWLSKLQVRPIDGHPLSGGNEHEIKDRLSAFAGEIATILRRAGVTPKTTPFTPLGPSAVSLAKLPSTSPDLFGRKRILQQLDDTWNDQNINVLSLVAWGGVGKTALVNKWLSNVAKDNYRGAARVYGWSFYSQGAAEGRQISADQFIAAALEWFGDPDPTAGSPWDKGERLAELIKRQRTLLILDGLEPLQTPPPIETGRIKDPALVSLLRELGRQNPGLVVISTRLAVDDLKDFIGSTALEIDLETLSEGAGAAYLEFLGADGTDKERKAASRDFGGHALALTLLGRYLKVVHNGDIRKRGEIPHVMDEQKQGAHARRVMASYEFWLKDKPELDILRLMGLFDRPAENGALDELREEPAIEGLTDALEKITEVDWKYAVNNLRDLRLLAQEDPHEPDTLDCHPLLREYFGEKLKAENQAAWREGNNRLYEYYKATAKELPDTLEEMAPLFAAVMHGCQAERYQDAYDEVYRKRIRRENEFYQIKKLGAIGADLAAISGFFDGTSWRKPYDKLREDTKGWLLNTLGYYLSALGRLAEATQPMQAGLDAAIEIKAWKNAARAASTISDLYLTIGDVKEALIYAEQGVGLADKSGDTRQRISNRTNVADNLHQNGNLKKSESAFIESEKILQEFPGYEYLFALWGLRYCDLLLDLGKYEEVLSRAEQSLASAKKSGALLDIALENLSLGRAHLLKAQQEPDHPISESLPYLDRAVDGLREAGVQEMIVRGLLARAEYYRITDDLGKAQKDLDEAFTIASRGGMGLHLADCHLEYARLALARGEKEDARKHWGTAKESIEKMGYHRRDKEVEELEEQLK